MGHVYGDPVRGPAGQKHRGDSSGACGLRQFLLRTGASPAAVPGVPSARHPLQRQARFRPALLLPGAHPVPWSRSRASVGQERGQVTCCPQTPRSAAGQTPFSPAREHALLGDIRERRKVTLTSSPLCLRSARGRTLSRSSLCGVRCGVRSSPGLPGESEHRRGLPGGSDPAGTSRSSCGLWRGPQALSPVCVLVLAGALLPQREGGWKVLEVHRGAGCTEPVYLTPLKCTLQNSEKW